MLDVGREEGKSEFAIRDLTEGKHQYKQAMMPVPPCYSGGTSKLQWEQKGRCTWLPILVA